MSDTKRQWHKMGDTKIVAQDEQGWACVLFKRTHVLAFFCVLYIKRTLPSLRSFTFFIKVRCVLYVLYNRMLHSLSSFTFFIEERGVLCLLLSSL